MFCTNCGAQNEPGTTFCTKCGARLGSEAVQPPVEGVPPVGALPVGAPPIGAGEPVPPTGYVPPPGGYAAPPYQDPTAKSKLAAGLLGIFLGGLGIHRFYLGYTNIGIAQLATDVIGWVLLPFTCGISMVLIIGAHVWGLVDGVMILTGSINRDAQGKPLRD
jgi:TM2 domain-containing membrane protein YozV